MGGRTLYSLLAVHGLSKRGGHLQTDTVSFDLKHQRSLRGAPAPSSRLTRRLACSLAPLPSQIPRQDLQRDVFAAKAPSPLIRRALQPHPKQVGHGTYCTGAGDGAPATCPARAREVSNFSVRSYSQGRSVTPTVRVAPGAPEQPVAWLASRTEPGGGTGQCRRVRGGRAPMGAREPRPWPARRIRGTETSKT